MMIKKISFTIITVSLVFAFLTNVGLASTYDEVIKGFTQTGKEAGYPTANSGPETGFTAAWAIYVTNFAVGAGAAFFMVLIIYGGWI